MSPSSIWTDGEATASAMQALGWPTEPLGVVVHNAGYHDDGPMAGMTADQWQAGHGYQSERILPGGSGRPLLGMARLRFGRVIAISSVAARLGNRGQANYAAAKAGLHGAVISLARENGRPGGHRQYGPRRA